jgi:hypothetical protein
LGGFSPKKRSKNSSPKKSGGSDIDHRGLHLLCQIGKGIGTFRLNPAFLFFPFEQLQGPEVFMDADENQPKANGHEDAKPFTLKTY